MLAQWHLCIEPGPWGFHENVTVIDKCHHSQVALTWPMEEIDFADSMLNFIYCGHCYQCGLALIKAWISNHMLNKVWNEITYSFPNFNSTLEMNK